ncbi:MAG TPA: hypothetical protein VN088_06025 [Nocardioides sp.]|nr:hypothetical protein [Nocardioides sp.]
MNPAIWTALGILAGLTLAFMQKVVQARKRDARPEPTREQWVVLWAACDSIADLTMNRRDWREIARDAELLAPQLGRLQPFADELARRARSEAQP